MAQSSPRGVTPNRVFRLDDDTWSDYADACAELGISRSDELRMHIKSVVAAHKRRKRTEVAITDADRLAVLDTWPALLEKVDAEVAKQRAAARS